MVPVVRNLVIQLSGRGIHPIQPFQAPTNLIHDVGNPVATGRPVRPIIVRKSFRVPLKGEQHLVDGIGGRGGVLETVGGIVPASVHIQPGAVLRRIRMPHDDGVFRVAAVAQKRIPAASLLAHVVQHKIRRTVIDAVIDGKYVGLGHRAAITEAGEDPDPVSPLPPQSTEIQAGCRLHPAQRTGRSDIVPCPSEDNLVREAVGQFETGHLYRFPAQ
jgi:hypothetical protein